MKRFSQISIKKQFLVVLASLMVIFLALSSVLYMSLDQLLLGSATEQAQGASQQFADEVQFLTRRIEAIYSSLLFDSDIETLMLDPFNGRTVDTLKRLQLTFSSYSVLNGDIIDIALVGEGFTWSALFDETVLQSYRKQLEGAVGLQCFGILEVGGAKRLVFGHNFYSMYDTARYGRRLGCIIIAVDPAKSPIALPGGEGGGTAFLLVDGQRRAYPFNIEEEEAGAVLGQLPPEAFVLGNAILPDDALSPGAASASASGPAANAPNATRTEDYLAFVAPVPAAGLYVVGAVDRHALNRETVRIMAVILLALAAVFAVLAYMMYIMMHNMVRPLDKLSQAIRKIHGGAGARQLPQTEGCAEIRELNHSFNELFTEEARLNAELHSATVLLYETELGKKQAELDFLRSQINPHFLYNALESVKDIAAENNIDQIVSIAGAMGKLFRYNVKGADLVPLSEEMEITKAYLDIQQARFPEKLNVIYSVREECKSIPMMKLLLQPLAENAVYHGIEPGTGPGTLFIGARTEGDVLLLTVMDDGVGIPGGLLADIQRQLNDMAADRPFSEDHIGLLNVHHRILLRYGPGFGLQVESTEASGTKVTLRMPVNGASGAPPTNDTTEDLHHA